MYTLLRRHVWPIVTLILISNSLCLGQRISGAATLKIDDGWNERIYAINQLEFFEDSTNRLTFKEISKERFQQFIKIRSDFSKNNFNTDYTYWVKLSIDNTPESKKKWLLEFYDQSIDHITAFIPDGTGGYTVKEMGDKNPFSQRLFNHKNFQLLLDNNEDGITNFYFKINSSQKADIRIALRSLNRFVHYALSEYFLYGFFYGMILIIAFYNFLIFLAVKEMKYVYYILYLLSVAFYAMSLDGIGFQYFWPNSPGWNAVVNGIFSFSIVLWAVLFTVRFLNTKRKAIAFHYSLWLSLSVKIGLFCLGLFVDNKYFELTYFDSIPFLLILSTSVFLLIKKYQAARFFVMAYGVLFIGISIKVLANYAIIPHNTLVYYSLHFAFLVEMVLLSFALGDRIRLMKEIRDKALKRSLLQYKENISLKEKVNKELESKVSARTAELQTKNKLLETYNSQLQEKDEEIKRINALLDKDNWKLKSSIRASFRARLTQKSLTLSEFREIFPDSSACYRYLEELKWGEGFRCRHCDNSKYGKTPKVFSRRCTKCGYINSVTSGTVFHGIKFPLDKAFYIIYASYITQEKLTLDQLATTLDLRRNTIWAFRKKVQTRIANSEESDPGWEEIVQLEMVDY
ncbi:7TM diverse intracellular signaling domain-containing protein [Cyclobacterium amurskyense]|uniref:Chromosome segregation ATPase n=1 Tax=Cyclobacterium amurskyense TaxID=320787 RepID=A0A0H4PLB5_9BACT|nr:7TM diverse intracellular signaling domain-containing protein [Cyclobacterium amurskyense]AKP53823.1 Chromosome segregation ATPase [Cyclobacterium amurskyense]